MAFSPTKRKKNLKKNELYGKALVTLAMIFIIKMAIA